MYLPLSTLASEFTVLDVSGDAVYIPGSEVKRVKRATASGEVREAYSLTAIYDSSVRIKRITGKDDLSKVTEALLQPRSTQHRASGP